MEYQEQLYERFKRLRIHLVKHDSSAMGMPCYIEVELTEIPKDKGALVLDLGNYIYRRFGLSYQSLPEYRGKKVRWFMSWDDVAPIQAQICAHFGSKVLSKDWLPINFYSVLIQTKDIQQAAMWKKTGEIGIYTQKITGSTFTFVVGQKEYVYMQAELGPIDEFEILGDL